MRISDWSSDVCSSDLLQRAFQRRFGTGEYLVHDAAPLFIPRNSKTATTWQTHKVARAHAKISRPPLGQKRLHLHPQRHAYVHPDRKSTRLHSSHESATCMPSSARPIYHRVKIHYVRRDSVTPFRSITLRLC